MYESCMYESSMFTRAVRMISSSMFTRAVCMRAVYEGRQHMGQAAYEGRPSGEAEWSGRVVRQSSQAE